MRKKSKLTTFVLSIIQAYPILFRLWDQGFIYLLIFGMIVLVLLV